MPFRELKEYSLSSEEQLNYLSLLSSSVRHLEGDIVECGVLNGGSAAALSFGAPNKRLYLFDSFMGMPEPTKEDTDEAWKDVGVPKLVGSIEKVKSAMSIVNANDFVIVPGWFEHTFSLPSPIRKISILHIDCDWYESVKMCLERFYPLVEWGGIVVLDDFGHWEGCREAFYHWAENNNTYPLLERFGHSQAHWIKGKKNNRDYIQ